MPETKFEFRGGSGNQGGESSVANAKASPGKHGPAQAGLQSGFPSEIVSKHEVGRDNRFDAAPSGPEGEIDDGEHVGTSVRTLFISDIHLGTRACQAEAFLDFIRVHEAETIFLVGDIIDFWRVRRGPIWPQAHNDVLQKILRKVRKGARVIFIPGNHDEALRSYCGMTFGGIEIHHDFIHETADGRRYLVMHGDEFDIVVRYAKWLAFLGDRGYEFALWCNHPLNWIRRRFGFGYWSLSAYLKLRIKSAVNFIGEFEHAIAIEAKKRDADGVICGHIHHAADRIIEGIRYLNCGDWVESCTAIVEDHDGEFRMIRWRDEVAREASLPVMQPVPAPLMEVAPPAAVLPMAHEADARRVEARV